MYPAPLQTATHLPADFTRSRAGTLACMSSTRERVLNLVARKELLLPENGHDELADDEIRIRDIVGGVTGAELLKDYPSLHSINNLLMPYS